MVFVSDCDLDPVPLREVGELAGEDPAVAESGLKPDGTAVAILESMTLSASSENRNSWMPTDQPATYSGNAYTMQAMTEFWADRRSESDKGGQTV